MLKARILSGIVYALFAVCLLLAAFAVSQTNANNHTETNAYCNQGNTRCGHYFPEKSADEKVADYTLALVLATVALAVIGAFQFGFLIQADRTANKAVDAAIAANQLTETSLVKLEAPRIYPVDFKFEPGAYPPCISVSLKNYGRSPAFIHSAFMIVSIGQLHPGLPKLFHKRKDFMVDGYIGVNEVSAALQYFDDAMQIHSHDINRGHVSFNVLVNFEIDDLIGGSLGSGRWFVWNWRRKKFVAGVQLWEPA